MPLQSPAADDKAACLLQNQFASGDVAVEEDFANTKLHDGSVESRLLFEGEYFEVANMMTIKQRSVARSKSCLAHLALLDRRTRVLEVSRNVSNKKLDEMVQGFIHHQSGSTDACSSQLMEAKHQLNQIHQYVIDLSLEINATEHAIAALDKELQALLKQMEELEKWKDEELGECEKETGESIAMLGKLNDEMEEMKQIANPKVSMNIHTGTIETADEEASELQTSVRIFPHREEGIAGTAPAFATKVSHRNVTADMERLGMLVQGTQTAVTQFMQCMGPQRHKYHIAALLAATVSRKPLSAKHFWTRPEKEGTVNKKCTGKIIGSLATAEGTVAPCKRKCEKMKNCRGFNREKGKAKCFFVSSCKKSKLASDKKFNAYFITGTMQFTGPGKGKNRMGDVEAGDELPMRADAPLTRDAAPLETDIDPNLPLEMADDNIPLPMDSPVDDSGEFNGAEGEGEAEGEGPTAEECEEEKEKLHKVYVQTYVELSRLKNEYSELANSTACKDGTLTEYESQKNPLQEKIDELLKAIDEKIKKLAGLRPRLEDALEAEKKMREQIKRLASECGELPETISDLGKVRDAIQALSRCPGLARVEFHLPKWTGTWITFEQDATAMSDEKQDELMNAACSKKFAGTRAAEVGEIEEQTVEGIPVTNTADVPLLGACPHCEGNDEASYIDKHARLCWPSGKALNHKDKLKNCGKGLKAILCVEDQGNIRNIPA